MAWCLAEFGAEKFNCRPFFNMLELKRESACSPTTWSPVSTVACVLGMQACTHMPLKTPVSEVLHRRTKKRDRPNYITRTSCEVLLHVMHTI